MIYRGIFAALCLAAGLSQAQPYRWIDDKGQVRYSGTPPPAGAKRVEKLDLDVTSPAPASLPFEIARLQKDYPVTLYTTPTCKEACAQARGAIGRRGIPFKEVQVWSPESKEELKKLTGALDVPTLFVGRLSQRGFEQGAYDALLDSAGYPKAGTLRPLSQSAPPPPESYSAAGESVPKPAADAAKAQVPANAGPYGTSGLAGPAPKPGPYGTGDLTGPAPKPGQYAIPGESK